VIRPVDTRVYRLQERRGGGDESVTGRWVELLYWFKADYLISKSNTTRVVFLGYLYRGMMFARFFVFSFSIFVQLKLLVDSTCFAFLTFTNWKMFAQFNWSFDLLLLLCSSFGVFVQRADLCLLFILSKMNWLDTASRVKYLTWNIISTTTLTKSPQGHTKHNQLINN